MTNDVRPRAAAAPAGCRVTLTSLSKTYTATTPPVAALDGVNLEIAAGEFVCLIGPSGCGKSTLLRLIADQLPPTQGSVSLDGAPPRVLRQRKAIAWLAQDPALLPWLTVLENCRLPLRVNRQARQAAFSPAALLSLVGLADFAGAYPAHLSGGMQQRAALARALVTGASLWLMDEPFAALDELTREQLTVEVLRLWRTFRPTVIWVTHSIAESVRLADRIVVLTRRPGAVRAVVPVPWPRPRDETDPQAAQLVRRVRRLLAA